MPTSGGLWPGARLGGGLRPTLPPAPRRRSVKDWPRHLAPQSRSRSLRPSFHTVCLIFERTECRRRVDSGPSSLMRNRPWLRPASYISINVNASPPLPNWHSLRPPADHPVHCTDIDPGNPVKGHHHADEVFAFSAVLLWVQYRWKRRNHQLNCQTSDGNVNQRSGACLSPASRISSSFGATTSASRI
jgi:hypothetical protein